MLVDTVVDELQSRRTSVFERKSEQGIQSNKANPSL